MREHRCITPDPPSLQALKLVHWTLLALPALSSNNKLISCVLCRFPNSLPSFQESTWLEIPLATTILSWYLSLLESIELAGAEIARELGLADWI